MISEAEPTPQAFICNPGEDHTSGSHPAALVRIKLGLARGSWGNASGPGNLDRFVCMLHCRGYSAS